MPFPSYRVGRILVSDTCSPEQVATIATKSLALRPNVGFENPTYTLADTGYSLHSSNRRSDTCIRHLFAEQAFLPLPLIFGLAAKCRIQESDLLASGYFKFMGFRLPEKYCCSVVGRILVSDLYRSPKKTCSANKRRIRESDLRAVLFHGK